MKDEDKIRSELMRLKYSISTFREMVVLNLNEMEQAITELLPNTKAVPPK